MQVLVVTVVAIAAAVISNSCHIFFCSSSDPLLQFQNYVASLAHSLAHTSAVSSLTRYINDTLSLHLTNMQCFTVAVHAALLLSVAFFMSCRAAIQRAEGSDEWSAVDHSVLAQAAEGRSNRRQ